MSFVHLHNHSCYSLLDGMSKLEPMVEKAKRLGMESLALTDHGNLYGAIHFYKTCLKHELKPIIGVEAYMAARSRHDKEAGVDSKRYHLTLLATSNTGYQNLIKMVTAANLEGYYYKPRMDKELLRKHREGVICLSGCLASELGRALSNKDFARAEQVALEYRDIFGPENYFLEIMHLPKIEGQLAVKAATIELAKKLKIPLVATCDCHYLETDEAKAHDIVVAVGTHSIGENDKRFSNQEENFSFIDQKTAKKLFADTPEALENTLRIADRVKLDFKLGEWVFPAFPLEPGKTADQMLTEGTKEKLELYLKKNPKRKTEANQRVNYELEVIIKKGYSPYFLVVADLIDFAHRNDIYTNTRGSAAGSMVSYLLGITNVDPLHYQLPFERFLNPHRPSPPDVDMDFADKRRDEVIDYAREKYGADRVAQIGTFGSMMAKAAVRDIARALGEPYATGDRLANLIPLGSQGFPMSISRALKLAPELKAAYKAEPTSKNILDLAQKIEGNPRHISVHAAGVVISPQPLTDYVPLQHDPRGGKIITQYDMHAVEDVGLLKFDFLGIRNLSILEDAVRLIKIIQKTAIDIEQIPLDDKKTYEMLTRGETMGLFQLNGSGMTRYLKELKPTRVEDLNVMVALYRPGPMDNINEYVARKHGKKATKFLHPKMKSFLEPTFGVLVYQDDLLMTAIEVAGYDWGQVDKFRKAVGKKIPAEMAKQHILFVEGCMKHSGTTKEKAEEIWKLFEPFQGYGFNKAHAASYGRVAYQTAYLKANYPTEYMTAVLSAESGDTETVAEVINECLRMGITVLPPDINESFGDFTVVNKNKIRFGLFTIKNLGTDIAEAIASEREANGHFKNLADFLERINHKNLNRKSLEALIKAGGLDSLGEERGRLLANLDLLVEFHREHSRSGGNQDSLFGAMTDIATVPQLKLMEAPAVNLEERLAWEKDLLGLYVSGHPLEKFRSKFTEDKLIKKLKTERDGALVVAGGVIEEAKDILTKRGERMAFLRLADFSDKIECVVFTRVYDQFKDLMVADKCLAVRGRLSMRNGEPSIVVESVKELV